MQWKQHGMGKQSDPKPDGICFHLDNCRLTNASLIPVLISHPSDDRRGHCVNPGHIPNSSHGCHGVNAHKHCGDGEPVLKPAEFLTKIPDVVTGINKIEDGIESRHQQIRKSQVNNKVISSSPHSPVCKNDPDDGNVANNGCDNDEGIGDSPQSNLPSRLGKLGYCRPIAAVLEGVSLRNVASI